VGAQEHFLSPGAGYPSYATDHSDVSLQEFAAIIRNVQSHKKIALKVCVYCLSEAAVALKIFV